MKNTERQKKPYVSLSEEKEVLAHIAVDQLSRSTQLSELQTVIPLVREKWWRKHHWIAARHPPKANQFNQR